MELSDTVKVLRGIPLFSKLDLSKLKLLAFASESLTFENGEVLFHAGDIGDSAYLIDEGEVEICAEKNGNETIVGTLGRHEVFGEMALFRNSPRSATIRARGRATVLRIDGQMFLKLVTENADAALGVMRALSDKLARATDQLEEQEEKIREAKAHDLV